MLDRSPLYALGFEELPPAGYLPWGFEDMDDVARQTAAQILFGPEVDVRVCKCRADFVAHAIEQVQHMDRIPLRGHVSAKPKVDLLIPCESSDLKSTWTRTYGWSAFVRRREDLCQDVPLQTAGPLSDYTPLLAAIIGLLIGAGTTTPQECEQSEEAEAEMADEPEAQMADEPEAEMADVPEAQMADEPEAQMAYEPEAEMADVPEAKPPRQAKKAPARRPARKSAAAPVAKPSALPGEKAAAPAKKAPTKRPARKSAAAPVAKPSAPPGEKAAAPAKKAPTKGPARK